MKICILGSTGVLGVAFQKTLKKQHIDFFALSHQDCDITDFQSLETILNENQPTHIINTVAIVGIDPCDERPLDAFNINTVPAYHLANYSQSNNITMIQIGTHAVFDGKKDGCYNENDTPNPMNIYAGSKLLADQFVESICDKYYITRVPTMFGERHNKNLGFTDKAISWLKSNNEVKVATDKIDTISYAQDISDAIIELIQTNQNYGVYHFANDQSHSFYEFVEEMGKILNIDKPISKSLDSDFPSKYYKSLKTPMNSVKGIKLRHWKGALKEFLLGESQ